MFESIGIFFGNILNWFTGTFVGQIISTAAVAMVPVIELRGAIPIGTAMGLNYWVAFIAAVIGNMIPVPFIMLFIKQIFTWMRKSKTFGKLVDKLEARAHSKGEVVKKYEMLGLLILVAIPLPGTGAWTGSLVASLFDIKISKAIPIITLGVIIAGVLTTLITQTVVFVSCG